MKIKQLQETTAGAVASVAMPIGNTHKRTEEAANPAQQAAIAIAMKKAGKKPKKLKENDEGYTEINPKSFLDDDFYAFDPETKVLKGTWSHKSVGRRHHEYEAKQKGYEVVSGMKAKHLGLLKKSKIDEYMQSDSGATPPKTPTEKPVDTKPYEEPKDKKDPKSYMTKESSIFKGVSEAHISEEELLLAPGQGIKFKTELMPKRTDHEVEMARNQLRVAAQSAKRIYQNIEDLSEIQGLDGWVQAKITKASDYLDAVNNYIEGKKQMLEIQDEVDEQVDAIDQRLTAQYNTPQMKAQSQAIDQAFASGDEREFQRLGIQSPQQIERDYQTMLAAEPAQDAALMRNPKLTPSARPAQRYNPKGVPIKEFDDRSPYDSYVQSRSSLTNRDGDEKFSKRVATLATDRHGNQRVRALDTSRDDGDEVTINTNIPKGINVKMVPQQGDANIEETKRLSTREKFKRSLKRAGYDPDAGADRLLNLIARQAEERKEFERKQKEQDDEFYGKKEGMAEGLKFHGGFPDVDHMRGAVHRDADMITDNVKTNNKKDWDRAVDSINARVFDDMSDFYSDSKGERVVGNSAVWAKWDNETQTGWFNAKGRPLKPWPVKEQGVEEDWQKTNRRDKTSGMSRKAVKQYRRENPGSKLQTAVTTKPSKLKKGSKAAKRRKSFCSRMRGMKKSRTSAKTARDPNSNINKALRRWNCESVEELRNLALLAEQKIAMMREEESLEENLRKWFKEKWVRFGPDGKIRGDCARGDDSEGKPKCLPQSKAHSLGKKGRASAAARKRREDPNPERSGPAINVATKKKSSRGVAEGFFGDRTFNRVMPMVKRIASEVSDYDRDEFGEELWSLLDQKYGSKFAQSVLQDDLDFYWNEYTDLTGQGVAEGSLNEFAPDGFTGGDDDEGFSPEIAKMAQEDGFTKGVSLADGATLERAITINYWHSQHGGMYKQYFVKGFKAGRMNKINHDNKRHNLNLKLMKDGSIRRGEQGVAEGQHSSFIQKLDAKLQQLGYKSTTDGNVHRWISPAGTFVEVEPDTADPGWYGWAEGQVTRSGRLNYGDSGNDSAKDIVAIFKSGGVFRKPAVAEGHELCPECGGAMYSEEMINEKKDACYYKVKSRYKVWPSAYASGALVKCRKSGAKNWGNKSK